MKKLRIFVFMVCTVGILMLLPIIALSTMVLKMSLEEIAQYATSILECEVVGTESSWDKQHTRIYTYVKLNVLNVYAGTHQPGPLTIRILGGTVGDIAMGIPGAPMFAKGEHLILFLEEKPDLLFPIVGLSQGKLSISVDLQTGKELAGNSEIGFFDKQDLLERVARAREGR